jgi:hypothetical protein
MSDSNCVDSNCSHHPHLMNPMTVQNGSDTQSETVQMEQQSQRSRVNASHTATDVEQGSVNPTKTKPATPSDEKDAKGLRRIIQNFTPS